MDHRPVLHPGVPRWAATVLTGRGRLGRTAPPASVAGPWLGALGVVGGLGVVKGLVLTPGAAVLAGGVLLLAPGAVVGLGYLTWRLAVRSGSRRYGDLVITADELRRAARDPEFADAISRVRQALSDLRSTRAARQGWLPVTGPDLAAVEWHVTGLALRTHRIRDELPRRSAPVAREQRARLTAAEQELGAAVADLETAAVLAARIDALLPTGAPTRHAAAREEPRRSLPDDEPTPGWLVARLHGMAEVLPGGTTPTGDGAGSATDPRASG